MSNRPFESLESSAPKRSLVVFPGALGDFVCFGPALERIAHRDSVAPALLLKESLAPLVRGLALAEALALEGPAGAWLFSGAPPPEADELFGSFGSIECFTGAGLPEVERNVGRWAGRAGRIHPFRPERPRHLASHFLERIGAAAEPLPEMRWVVPGALAERGARFFPRSSNGTRPLVVQPGSGGLEKRWSREGFRKLALRWVKRGGTALVALGPAEAGEAAYWRNVGLAVVESPPVDELAGLLSRATACVGNDSGTTHLAAAVGAPGVALFGPTDERCWRPLSSRWQTVRLSRWIPVDEPADDEAVAAVERALSRMAELTG